MNTVINTIIPVQLHGLRVDSVLAELLPEFSRAQITRWLKSGDLTINQRVYQPKEKVYGHEVVALNVIHTPHRETDAAENIQLSIVFEDAHLLILNKPAGLVVHPGAGNPTHTLVNALLHHNADLANLPRAGIVHRLDKETTGLLIVAKTLPTYTALIEQMQKREIERSYLSLVQGEVHKSDTIETGYGRHPRNRVKMAVCAQGKQAITHYRIRKSYPHFTLLDIKLLTGRTHQIRVHMQHIRHHVVGDPVYGGRLSAHLNSELKPLFQAFQRQALHAYKLSLTHPITHELISVEAPLPTDFQDLINALEITTYV